MAGGLVVLAAAWTWATHGPLAAPAVMKHWPPLLPQKQFVGSPDETQVAALVVKHCTASMQSCLSALEATPQQPSLPEGPSAQFAVVQGVHMGPPEGSDSG